MPDRLIAFYEGGTDHVGRRLDEILAWPDERLEAVHDFIQWLFPLTEASPVNPLAPVLEAETITRFRQSPELRASLRVAFDRMLRFYGLESRNEEVVRSADFEARSKVWLWPGNHNHLRITRILRCAHTLGLEREARAFLECLMEIYREEREKARAGISAETFQFWSRAVR